MRHQFNNSTNPLGRISALSVLMLLFQAITLLAQQNTDFKEQRIQNAFAKTVSIYDNEIGSNSMVNTGSSYYDVNNGIKGHQFFLNDYWEQGSVVYDGHVFDSIYLKYDIHKDQLLIEHYNSEGFQSPIKLYKPKVSSFVIMDYSFIRIEKHTTTSIKPGYYNLMYDGNDIQMLVKRRKEVVRSNGIGSISEEFSEKAKYFIKRGDQYYQVRKMGSILKVLSDQKKELKSFIKKNGFRFKTKPDLEFTEVVKYYNSLTK